MADQQQLENALRRAHAAGDTEAARRLVRAMKAQPAQQPQQEQAPRKPLGSAELMALGGTFDPTEGNSFLQNAAEGAGKSLVDTYEGVKQLFGQGMTPEQVADRRALDAPLMETGGGIVGNIAGQVGQIAVPVGGGARLASYAGRAAPYVAAAARGGAFAASQPVATGESRGGNAAAGAALGAAGQGAATVAGKVASGMVSRLDDASKGLAQLSDRLGFRLGAGDLAKNSLTRTAVSQMERLPFAGGTARAGKNQAVFNRLVAQEIGENTDKITPQVYAGAKQRIGGVFEELSSKNSLTPTPELARELAQLSDEAGRLAGSDTARMVKGWINELVTKADDAGVIPGKAYQSFDSRIGKVIKSGGEPANYLGQLREAVRSSMDESIGAADKAAWQTARRQYAALKAIEPLVAKSPTGDIAPTQLMGRMMANKAAVARMAEGRAGPLGDLAKIGQRFLKDAPNSGTADRALVNSVAAGGGAGLLTYLSPTVAMTSAGILGGNRMLLGGLNSRALTQGGSKTLNGLAKASKAAPRLLPVLPAQAAASNVPMDIGMVEGYDPRDPRYRGN